MSKKRMQKLRRLPVFKKSVKSIYTEVGGNRPNKHESKDTLIKHMPIHQRFLGKDVVKEFIREGYLIAHRTNTYSLTKSGENFCKKVLSEDPFLWLKRIKGRFVFIGPITKPKVEQDQTKREIIMSPSKNIYCDIMNKIKFSF